MAIPKQLIFLMGGGQLQGLGRSLKAIDPDTKGTDDLIGTICDAGGSVMLAEAMGNLRGKRNAVKLINEMTDQWLAENPE